MQVGCTCVNANAQLTIVSVQPIVASVSLTTRSVLLATILPTTQPTIVNVQF